MIVADTNLIVYLLIEAPSPLRKDAALVFKRDPEWCVPTLWRSEFANVLATHMRVFGKSVEQTQAAMRTATVLLENREYMARHSRVLELADASRKTAYDCEFIELAERLGVPLVTNDGPLLRAYPQHAITPKVFLRAGR